MKNVKYRYKIKGYTVCYANGSMDKVNLVNPILTNDKESERTKIFIKSNKLGLLCKCVNLCCDEFNL